MIELICDKRGYKIKIFENETIEIKINDNVVVNYNVPAGYETYIDYNYRQQKIE